MKMRRPLWKMISLLLAVCLFLETAPFEAQAAVKLNKTKVTVKAGNTVKLKLSGASSVKWKSSAPKVASVTAKGVVKGKKTGTAVVTATDKKTNKSYTCKVTVKINKLDKALKGISSEYDTSSMASVCLPDPAVITGHYLYHKTYLWEDKLKDDFLLQQKPNGMTEDAYRVLPGQIAQEYFNLLASLPYLEVIVPYHNYAYGSESGMLRYIGTGNITKNAIYSDDLEEYGDVMIEWKTDSKNTSMIMSVHHAEEFEFHDTGHRLTLGEDWPRMNCVGKHAQQAYYYDGTKYYSEDKKLSVKSGRAAVLLNGKAYSGKVSFETNDEGNGNLQDTFTVTNFYRSDLVKFYFPADYPQAKDVFVAQDFQWANFRFGFSLDNGVTLHCPWRARDNYCRGINVRILQWDKSGDTVIYFFGKYVIAGTAYNIEGLFAVPYRGTAGSPNGGSGGSGGSNKSSCTLCGGDGRCSSCGGSGSVSNFMILDGKGVWVDQNCPACSGSGVCRECGGSGES